MTRLGVNVPNFGPTASAESLHSWAGFIEEHGFALAMMSDHVAPTPDVTALYPSPFYDAFTTLAWLAGMTERIELGTSVAIVPYRHPLLTARLAANIDQFSAGRFILGVGVGWSEPEFTALGVPFRRRGDIADEYLAAILAAWTTDTASLDGRYAGYRDVSTGPRSARSPHPPLWIGGTAPAAIVRAARFGDAWHPNNAELEWLRDKGLPALAAAAADDGRPMPAFCPRVRAQVTPRDLPEVGRRVGTGSLAQLCHDVTALTEMGAAYVVLDTNPDDPRDRNPTAADWRVLSAIAERLR